MRVCFLGTGGSWPTRKRNPLSFAVTSGRTNILVECGEGTQRQMLSAPISPIKLDAIFISHLHGDHFLGLPGLVQTMSLNDRTNDLHVYGPEGFDVSFEKAMTMCHYHPRFETIPHIIEPGELTRVKDLNIKAGNADHGIPALSFRIFEDPRPGRFNREKALELGIPEGKTWSRLQNGETITIENGEGTTRISPSMVLGPPRKGRSIAYSGDTAPTDELISIAKDSDILIHEATYSDDLSDKAAEYKHSTATQAALIARKAKVGKLYLVHSSPRYSRQEKEKVLLIEAKKIFSRSFLPDDLDCIEINR